MNMREQQRAKLRICLKHLTKIAANKTGKLYRMCPKERSRFTLEAQRDINDEIDMLVNSLIPIND